MGANVTGWKPVSGTTVPILTGPAIGPFLKSVLKGGSGMVEFGVQWGRVRGVSSSLITVEICSATPEDGSGRLFLFTGSYQGYAFKGYYNATPDSPDFGTGTLTFS